MCDWRSVVCAAETEKEQALECNRMKEMVHTPRCGISESQDGGCQCRDSSVSSDQDDEEEVSIYKTMVAYSGSPEP